MSSSLRLLMCPQCWHIVDEHHGLRTVECAVGGMIHITVLAYVYDATWSVPEPGGLRRARRSAFTSVQP